MGALTTAAITVVLTSLVPVPVRYALPLPAAAVTSAGLRAPHHDYAASDLFVPVGTPVLAATGGAVRVITGGKCGIGVAIAGDDGYRYVNCHLSSSGVRSGDRVQAGDVIGLSGDSGNARGTTPHLHFHIKNPAGDYLCPQPLLVAWHAGRSVGPRQMARTTGCSFPRA